ncbi:hypothetical protein CR513_54676, partial [Mucuna pruriens]
MSASSSDITSADGVTGETGTTFPENRPVLAYWLTTGFCSTSRSLLKLNIWFIFGFKELRFSFDGSGFAFNRFEEALEASSGKFTLALLPRILLASVSYALAASSAVLKVPSQTRTPFLGSRISAAHFPHGRCRIPLYWFFLFLLAHFSACPFNSADFTVVDPSI